VSSAGLDLLLLHPKTKLHSQLFIERASQVLLIVGSPGSGKKALARAISSSLLQLEQAKLDASPLLTKIGAPEGKQEISIDAVRQLISDMKLKSVSNLVVNRVIIIHRAEQMSLEAQNALLKLLEEPPPGALFILTAPSQKSLLPTIVSRAWVLPAHGVDLPTAKGHFGQRQTDKAIESAWSLSGGSSELMEALLRSDRQHPLKLAVTVAKEIASKDVFFRIVTLDALSKDKDQLKLVVLALTRIMDALHRQAVLAGKKNSGPLLSNRRLLSQSHSLLESSANTRLVALNLALNLKL